MARTPRARPLETRTARLRLEPNKKPYWERAGKTGVFIGYRRRKPRGRDINGTWLVRRLVAGTSKYKVESLDAEADDFSESDSATVLSYSEAVERISEMPAPAQTRRNYTVNEAVADYVDWLKLNREDPRGAEIRLKAYLIPYFDGRQIASLTADEFDNWLKWAYRHRPRGRRKAEQPAAAKKRARIEAAELDRRRKETLNRTINAVKACLNRAFEKKRKLVPSDAAWRGLKKFKGVSSSRTRWLTVAESQRLINACGPNFRRIVQAALLTGARWGELRSMRMRDYEERSGTVLIPRSKGGKSRRVPLTDEGRKAFEYWTVGRNPEAYIFTDDNGNQWGSHDQHRPMKAACIAANIEPPVGIHQLRHSYASSLVQAGVSLAIVGEALGHTDTRMVSKHYGHLAPSHVADAIRAHLPTLGIEIETKVRKLK